MLGTEVAAGVGCFFLPAGRIVEGAAGAPEVVCHILWCCFCPPLRYRGRHVGGWEVWVREVEAAVVEVEGEEDLAGWHVQAASTVAHGPAVGEQGLAPQSLGNGLCVVRRVRRVMSTQAVPEFINEGLKEAGCPVERGAAGIVHCVQWAGLSSRQ